MRITFAASRFSPAEGRSARKRRNETKSIKMEEFIASNQSYNSAVVMTRVRLRWHPYTRMLRIRGRWVKATLHLLHLLHLEGTHPILLIVVEVDGLSRDLCAVPAQIT